jgi:hypothetical protein
MIHPYMPTDLPRLLSAEFPAAVFPDLAQDLVEADGLLHLEMGAFASFMQRAKGRADWELYRRGVRLADTLWSISDPALLNALGVSFLEHLDFNGPRGSAAWALLTPRLQVAWRSLQALGGSEAKGSP